MNLFDPSLQGFLWVLAIALTIIVIDVFFETEILSVVALIGISIYFSLLFDVSVKWKVLLALLCWLALTALFYTVWKRVFAPLIRLCLPAGSDEAIHSAVGSVGEFRLINGKTFVQWNGDLWPVDLDPSGAIDTTTRFTERQKVTIIGVAGGIFTITELSTNASSPPKP